MPRSELTLTIKRVEVMIAYVRENLDEGEYDLFLDLILPEPEPMKVAKRGRKKAGRSSSKSSRASGMAAAINRSLSQGRQVVKDGSPCFATVDDNDGEMTCGKPEDDSVHDTRYLSSHPFVWDSRAAQPAHGKSSTNGAEKSSILNFVDETVSAGAVVGGSGE